MPVFAEALAAWPGESFKPILKRSIEAMDKSLLPLQQGLSHGNCVGTSPIRVVVLGAGETPAGIQARIGVFYTGIIGGCSCADDPTPVDEINEHCELLVVIDKRSGQARFELAD
jgi:hypothetical protein